jgi:hypothetical protein
VQSISAVTDTQNAPHFRRKMWHHGVRTMVTDRRTD